MSSRNVHGGKGFKKGKKKGGVAAGDERAYKFMGREDGQDYARVVRLLGNRRALCFCNDGAERVGKIRGAICRGPRKQIIGVGDIVLVSERAFQADGERDSDDEADSATAGALTTVRGHRLIVDILHKYDTRDWRSIRKEGGIHPALLGVAGAGVIEGAAEMDDIFDHDEAEGSEKKAVEEESGDEDDLDIDAI
jgi:initiation factor 1A